MLLKTYTIPCGQINIIRENWGDFYVRVAAENSDINYASSLQFGHLESLAAAEDLAESIIRKMQELIQKHLQSPKDRETYYSHKTASDFSATYHTNRKHVNYYAIQVNMNIVVYWDSYTWSTGGGGLDGNHCEVICLCLRVTAKDKKADFQLLAYLDYDDILNGADDFRELIECFNIPEPKQAGEQLALF